MKGDNGWVVGGWAGKVSKGKKGGGGVGEKIKFQKKIEIIGKNNWEVSREKIKVQKKLRLRLIRAKKGQKKKAT